MPDQILLNCFEHRPTRFSVFPQRVKVAEADVTKMTVGEVDKIAEIQKMIGRTCEIKRQPFKEII